MLSGTEPGRGAFYGQHDDHARCAADGEFVTQATYRYADGGQVGAAQRKVDRLHRLSNGAGARRIRRRARRDTVGLREVMFVEPGWEEMSGRWFTGGYEEIGMDVSLKKLGANPVLPASRRARCASERAAQDVTIFGANLPKNAGADRRSTSGPA